MMKISKPVLTNELLLSSVQFTSLNSILFKNVKNVYDGSEKIKLEYEHSPKIEASSRDWIGIFPHGWTTLQQYVTFEWVSQSFPSANSEQDKENADLVRRTVNFCPKYLMSSVNVNSFYQFVYISKQIEVLGVSSYFRFDMTRANSRALELECLVPVSSKVRSTSVSDFGILLGNNLPSSTSIDTRTLQTSSIHSLQNLDPENKNWTKPPISLIAADSKKTTICPRKATGTGDALDPYTSHSEPIFPMSFQMANCKKCFHFKRGGEFLRSQQVLQSKLKIVMERNKVLEERTQEMKTEMERLQTESKKLKMSYYYANKEKVAYEKFVKDFIKSLEKDSIVRVVNGNTEILVKRVNYVGMEEHPRGKKTSKRERELKAVIGLQEITIRNLINSLQEKAKSVNELNETVKLAQAFSSARGDSRDYGSDVEEALDEVSNSDVTSEYEFSLTKPQPPEESTVGDIEAALDDIRRTTEMELKDIGINRSLGKSSSRDSELELPNLSVRSYHNQSEGTRPKKPRLFDNLEDCWPFSETENKTVHRKVMESSPRLRAGNDEPNDDESVTEQIDQEEILNENPPEEEASALPDVELNDTGTIEEDEDVVVDNDKDNDDEDVKSSSNLEDSTNYEDYYDAYEDNENPQKETKEMNIVQEDEDQGQRQVQDQEQEQDQDQDQDQDQGQSQSQGQNENVQTDNNNFLVTAIVPQDMNINSVAKSDDQWMKVDQEELQEKKVESQTKRGKKFSCELSIDFTSKRNHEVSEERQHGPVATIRNAEVEQVQNNQMPDVIPFNGEIKREKSLVTYKKTNKCLEIKITQVDQKDNQTKNYVHQKMVVKFGQNSQQPVPGGPVKPSKFEFNLALSGVEDDSKKIKADSAPDPRNNETDLDFSGKDNLEPETSPRTVWNDASDDREEDPADPAEDFPEEEETCTCTPKAENGEIAETQSVSSENSQDESPDKLATTNSKSYEDSLRYEKNLEFLQQKNSDRIRDEEDVMTKDKPSAILIQNGQTKLALIRYQ